MLFHSDTELSVFLWRYFAPKYEKKLFIPMRSNDEISAIEQTIGQTSDWRFDETQIKTLLTNLDSEKVSQISFFLSSSDTTVEKERENCWIDDFLSVKVKCDKVSTTEINNMETVELVEIFTCILSICGDQRDSWSATRLFCILQEQVLPSLRRLATVANLTIVQTLFSYVMQANIQENAGNDVILGRHIVFLKQLDKVVDDIHNHECSPNNPIDSIKFALQRISQFLLGLKQYSCDPKVKDAQQFILKHAEQVVDNFAEINKLSPSQQKAPSFLTSRERLFRLLIDRIQCLDLFQNQRNSSVFKTPQVSKPVEEEESLEDSGICVTPKAVEKPKVASFINNGTPTPIRPPTTETEEDDDELGLSPIDEEDDENKENIDPEANKFENTTRATEKCSVTPVRSKKNRLPLREKMEKAKVAKRTSNASKNDSKKAKTSSNQPSIMSFFK